MRAQRTRHIAVVGSGVAGLSAAWLLNQTHRVTLFESDHRVGGHAHTVTVPTADGPVPVDTGFIVYNDCNYPNFIAFLDHLGVATTPSDMSFAVSIDHGRIEYGSRSVGGFIGRAGNLLRPSYYRMLLDLLRFYREAPRLLDRPDGGETLGQYLDANGYSNSFVEEHLLPMGAAIWSTTADQMRAYPLLAFIRFFQSHGLLELNVFKRPKWRSVRGGSRSYVQRIVAGLSDIRLGAKVTHIRRRFGQVEITDAGGRVEIFDDVVIAAHADQALAMLDDADQHEEDVLGAFAYTDNTAVLHTDLSLMPRRRHTWASWNYIGETGGDDGQPLCVTYWMNHLQSLPTSEQLFVTLNPIRPVAEGTLIQAIHYSHPLFDRAALDAQQRLPLLQGRRNTWFCGSYFGHGFHEDALQSGLAVAEALGGVRRPWAVGAADNRVAYEAPQQLEAAE